MSVNRLNCCATSPDYFLALIFCLPSATDLNKSIRGRKNMQQNSAVICCGDSPLILMAFIKASSGILEASAAKKLFWRENFPGSWLM